MSECTDTFLARCVSRGVNKTVSESQATLFIGNRMAEFVRVEAWLAHLIERWDISENLAYAIDLVLNEAVTNVIRYAYEDSATHTVTITLTNRPEAIQIEIDDDGRPFDPLKVPPMSFAPDLEHAPIGGRGIRLIKHYADEQSYSRIAGFNRLRLLLRKDQ